MLSVISLAAISFACVDVSGGLFLCEIVGDGRMLFKGIYYALSGYGRAALCV